MAERRGRKVGAILALFVLVVFGAAAGLVLWVNEASEERDALERRFSIRTDYLLCVQAKANREAIRAAIAGGDPLDLKPGDYGYSYAQAHPQEAINQSVKLDREEGALALFPEIKCPPNPDAKKPPKAETGKTTSSGGGG